MFNLVHGLNKLTYVMIKVVFQLDYARARQEWALDTVGSVRKETVDRLHDLTTRFFDFSANVRCLHAVSFNYAVSDEWLNSD